MITAYVHQEGSLNKIVVSGLATRAVVADLPAVDMLPSHLQEAADHAARDPAARRRLGRSPGADTHRNHAVETAFAIEVPDTRGNARDRGQQPAL